MKLSELKTATHLLVSVESHLGRGWDYISSAEGSEFSFELNLETDGSEFPEATLGKFELVCANSTADAWTLHWSDAGKPEYVGVGDSPTKAYYNLIEAFEASEDADLMNWAASAE